MQIYRYGRYDSERELYIKLKEKERDTHTDRNRNREILRERDFILYETDEKIQETER